MRGATTALAAVGKWFTFQSTRPMRGATFSPVSWRSGSSDFNPRAPCGARQQLQKGVTCSRLFQSTRPMRGATTRAKIIRITGTNFNPRAPCGARLPAGWPSSAANRFQSTRPMRGATPRSWPCSWPPTISIHAPHAGRDYGQVVAAQQQLQFQSTRPMRGATGRRPAWRSWATHFNPRAPCGARLPDPSGGFLLWSISIHAPHAGRDVGAP